MRPAFAMKVTVGVVGVAKSNTQLLFLPMALWRKRMRGGNVSWSDIMAHQNMTAKYTPFQFERCCDGSNNRNRAAMGTTEGQMAATGGLIVAPADGTVEERNGRMEG